ncbi:MAG: DNA repair protein RadA [Methylococcales bacterium]|nr:DNA repair protein RadA [Methylococcales bacterium]
MATQKSRIAYVCEECGADYSKWSGQCLQCSAWNSIREIRLGPKSTNSESRTRGFAGTENAVQYLSAVGAEEIIRIRSGMQEFDRVLGGGFVPGSVVLLSGDPGAGKSTILVQTLGYLSEQREVLYVSGEESLQQIAGRARRINLPMDRLKMLGETSVDRILAVCEQEKPEIVVIDSIQVMCSDSLDAVPGGVVQVRECAALLTQAAKRSGMIVLIVGHVTKDQTIAGPMTLSHIVDTQIMLSSTEDSRYRVLRATKNRFGAVNEIGLFAMTSDGLREVHNPSAMFLSRLAPSGPGSVVNVLWEGTRPLLVEIQALVVQSQHGNPRRLGVGIDQNRIAMLLAVLSRHGGVLVSDHDVFINCVGGVRVTETSTDLAVVLGILSSLRNTVIPPDVFVFGEIGLSGEIRPVANGEARMNEAFKHGFKRAIVPKGNAPRKKLDGVEVVGVAQLSEAIDSI